MANVENKKLKGKVRSSFVERAEKTLEEYKLESCMHSEFDSKILDKKLKANWRDLVEKERKDNKVYFSERI